MESGEGAHSAEDFEELRKGVQSARKILESLSAKEREFLSTILLGKLKVSGASKGCFKYGTPSKGKGAEELE